MRLSVIIPIYNTQDTLKRCINSVLAQSLSLYEIILVNDGSTDCSQEICEQYKQAYPSKIRILTQKNKGLSEARNAGIEIARGTYITFVDSDDYISPTIYKEALFFLESHSEIDFIEYSYIQVNERKDIRKHFILSDNIYNDKATYWLKEQSYKHAYAWNKIYKRNLFKDNLYPAGRKFEDIWMMNSLLSSASLIATTSKGFYFYTSNPQGITATADGYALQDLLQGHLLHIHSYCDSQYYKHLLNIQLDVSEQLKTPPQLPIKHYWSSIKLFLLNILGFNSLCKINTWIHKIYHKNH